MDEEKERNRLAAEKNLAYIRRQLGQADTEECSPAKKARVEPPPGPEEQTEEDGTATSVYVDGLQSDVTEKQLQHIFDQVGKVVAVKLYFNSIGLRKGDGLVTFAAHDSVTRAVNEFNGSCTALPGSEITVSKADFNLHSTPAQDSIEEKLAGIKEKQEVSQDVQSIDYVAAAQAAQTRKVILFHCFDPAIAAAIPAQPAQTQAQTQAQAQAQAPPSEHEAAARRALVTVSQDIRMECRKFGWIDSIHCLANGAVMLQFGAARNAGRCAQVMHGRWFDERQLVADYLPNDATDPSSAPPCRAVLIRNAFEGVQSTSTAAGAAGGAGAGVRLLPAGWTIQTDPSSATVFFHQTATGRSQWAHPGETPGEAQAVLLTQLQSEFAEECSAFGPVESVEIVAADSGGGGTTGTKPAAEAVLNTVRVVFMVSLSALDCAMAMHGRGFDGRFLQVLTNMQC
jgi:hypothetical protein